ncbi:glycosyltransferase [Pseudomonas oryzihabitans]|uniref:glycosyltransferase n=1 Tax=Pseudomonas oryzihabitans TaxID=47885 RepID=UPI00285729E0|nr:glycosyltransferase [Pseudomonas psychrotolerans]MDR6679571.1 glycosyltransferase involved in cell wall biosynthesis [Pseudomonas psychrotolerans]
MAFYPVLLSVVFVVRNQATELQSALERAAAVVGPLVSDYELIIVDNASSDDSVACLKQLTSINGLPNLQVYALTKEVDSDTAAWVGLENALGDFAVVIDPETDDIAFLPEMLKHAAEGTDVVFANNRQKVRQTLSYNLSAKGFNYLYKRFNGVDLAKDAPQYRMLSKKVINYILRHPAPALTYRHLPATAGFSRSNLEYSAQPRSSRAKRLSGNFDKGARLLVSSTRKPMRMVSFLSIVGAMSNLLYSIYVIAVGLFKDDVAPGWVTISLQQSGMFFLISLVLLVLGEYVLQLTHRANEGPLYHVAQEFTSAVMTRRDKLNVEVVQGGSVRPATQSGVA